MNYSNIEEYLKENKHFDKPVNELWIVDNVAIKSIEIKNLLPNHFHPKIVQNEISSLLKEFFFSSDKVILNAFEKELLIRNIIERPENIEKFKKLEGNLSKLITCLDNVRLYPSYQYRFETSNHSNTSLLVKSLVEELLVLFRTECEKLNFTDDIEIKLFLAELPEIKLTKYDRIVIYGNFFSVDEITWKIFQNFCFSSTKEIVFVSSMSEVVKAFFENRNFISFQDNIKDYFFSDKDISLQNQIKYLDPNKVTYTKFSDWDEELNYIAREIKNAIHQENLLPEDFAIYIPKEETYSFKVEKVLEDFELPYKKSYSQTLSKVPLGNFFRWFLEVDFNDVKDVFKLVKSPFISISFEDFSVPQGETLFFNEKQFNSDELKTYYFDVLWLETTLASSGISFFNNEEENLKKLEESFKRKFEYELKKNSNTDNKIEEDFQKAYYFLKYFKRKVEEISLILPASCTPEVFRESVENLLTELKIDQRFRNTNEEIPTHYKNVYNALKNVISSMCTSLTKVSNKSYNREEYRKLYIKQAEESFFKDDEVGNGILITELSYISKVSFKRVYQVGMSSSNFPTPSSKNTFSTFLEIFRPIGVRETQLAAFAELLNNTITKESFTLHLSYPVIISNQEDEPSEVFADLEVIKPVIKSFRLSDKVFSLSQKAEAIGKKYLETSEKEKEILNVIEKRKSLEKWSEYEGFLEEENKELLSKPTSVTQIEEYASCPMKYFFNQKLKLKKQDKTFKDLDSSLVGTLIHKILEQYYLKAKSKTFFAQKNLLSEESKALMLEIANMYFKTYEESLNNLYIDKLKLKVIGGLIEGKQKSGILLELLKNDQNRLNNIVINKREHKFVKISGDGINDGDGWIPSHFELNFELEIDELKFIGTIDRIDEHESNGQFDIVDYKSGKIDASVKRKQIFDGLSYQLPVYSEAFKVASGKELHHAGYYTLKKEAEDDSVSFAPVILDYYSFEGEKEEKYPKDLLLKQSMKNLAELKGRLLNSEYNYTIEPEKEEICKYCDYKTICRYNDEKAAQFIKNPKADTAEELSLDFITKEMFTFPKKNNQAKTSLTDNQEKALDITRNIIVTAGAGAGKTEVLTKRMNKLIEAVKGNVEKLLVITFTKKATAEMQNRIYSSLINTLKDDNYKGNKELIKKAKLNFHKNWISTIDAFYLRLLRENLLELGVESDIEVADKQELSNLISETIEKKVDEFAVLRDGNLKTLLNVWNRTRLIEILNKLINLDWIDSFIENEENLPNKYFEIYAKQAEFYKNKLSEMEARIPDISGFNDTVFKVVAEIRRLINLFKLNLDKFLSEPNKYNYNKAILFQEGYKFPSKSKFVKIALSEKFFDELTSYLKPELEIDFFLSSVDGYEIEQNFLTALVSILKTIKEEYNKKREERNIYTFNDVARKLYLLIKDNEKVRKNLSTKFDFIMIDEFQDTNTYQYEIAKYLAGWDGKTLESINKDKLFFVGDEKQSIYQFRGGDVQVFNKAKVELKEVNLKNNLLGEHVEFPDNFRSSKNLVSFFNDFFKVVFDSNTKKKIYEAEHQDLVGHKVDGSINFFLFNQGMYNDKELRQNLDLEPKFVASLVKKILEFNPQEEIALLFRTRKAIPLFAKALEKLEINYVIYGGTGFYENQEIIDLINILSFLIDEKRILEFVGFLRSSFIGLSDKEILALKPNIKKSLKEKHPEIYNTIFGLWEDGKLIQKGWKQLICELSIHKLIEKITNETFGKIAINADYGYRQKLKNLERLVEISKAKEINSLEEFIEFVKFQIEQKVEENNGTIIELGDIKPVQLMTIHKSKGLGFDTVIIANGSAESFKEEIENIHMGDLELSESDEIFKDFIGFKHFDEELAISKNNFIKKKMSKLLKAKADAELKRLLYVAMTRAKNNLIFSASVWDVLRSAENSFIQFIIKYVNKFKEIDEIKENIPEEEKLVFKDQFAIGESGNQVLNYNKVDFHIFNNNHKITFPITEEKENDTNLSIVDKVTTSKPKIYAYSTLKDKPEVIKSLVINNENIKVTLRRNTSIKQVNYDSSLSTTKDEEGKLKKLRGNTIHKLLEHEFLSSEVDFNMLKNNLPPELVANAYEHYCNLKLILEDISKDITLDYHELPFLDGQITGIFDKLVKTQAGWEIWDYKVSDSYKEESIIKEAQNEYKLQYLIYTQKLAKLLNLTEVKYKLLFSNFGVVEITKDS